MNNKALQILEYNKIIDMLCDCATSSEGRTLCRKIEPLTDLSKIQAMQQETSDALSVIWKCGSLSLSGIKDVGVSLKRLEIGGSLGITELLDISSLLGATLLTKRYFGNAGSLTENAYEPEPDEEGFPQKPSTATNSLYKYTSVLEPLTFVKNEIDRCIISEDEIADDASPTLKHIRRSMALANEKIHSTLTSMIASDSSKGYLQDSIITMRNGRYCVPVKQEYKKQVPGMIHDQSSKGVTLFVEPMAVVQLNNELSELALKEKEEIAVILANISVSVSQHIEEISENYKALKQLDFIFARASLSKKLKCSEPVFNNDKFINLKQARHPLLDAKKVVPIDINLGDTFDLLIITGPNTGGKTVTLKTVGLLSLMGQSGLHIPAFEGSSLGIFNEIYADIGDEQSIEQSLSTFSAHMKNIIHILDNADGDSLVLFDELCAGTDPVEGAALGISILNFLHNMKVRCMATTHYSELKLFALSTEGVINASCEFDVASLSPTYRLLIGVPGKSNAFAISGKLGLPDFIINDAKTRLDEDTENFEDILQKLEANRIQIEKDQEEIANSKAEIQRLKQEYSKKKDSLDARREREINKAKEEASRIISEAKDFADQSIKEINKYSKSGNTKDLERTRTKVGEKLKNTKTNNTLKRAKANKTYTAKDFHLGDAVKVLTMGVNGTVSSLPNAKGDLFVQMGILRSQVNIRDLEIIDEVTVLSDSVKIKKTGSGDIRMSKALAVSTEINLLGKTVDEAIGELDKYLDDAYLAHLPKVSIVHGKGTGALRQGIHNYLKKSKYVKNYRLGDADGGGAGVTIVEFK